MKKTLSARILALLAGVLSVVVASLLLASTFASAEVRHIPAQRFGGPKPTIVLEHGGSGDGARWDQVVAAQTTSIHT
jgi:hypothetical protein